MVYFINFIFDLFIFYVEVTMTKKSCWECVYAKKGSQELPCNICVDKSKFERWDLQYVR